MLSDIDDSRQIRACRRDAGRPRGQAKLPAGSEFGSELFQIARHTFAPGRE
jgi:hypothetical protein